MSTVQPLQTVQLVKTVKQKKKQKKRKDCGDCGVCIGCGGFEALWKSVDDWARQNADTLDTTDTLSSCSSSEVDDDMTGRLDRLLEDSFSSEDEEEDKVPPATPSRRSLGLSLKPHMHYEEEPEDHVARVRQLHPRAVEKTLERWRDNTYMVKIQSEMQSLYSNRELDRFAAQLEREVEPVPLCSEELMAVECIVDKELLDQIEQQL